MAHSVDSFLVDAAALFGMDEEQATDLLESLEEDYGFDVDSDSLKDYGVEATDYLEDVFADDPAWEMEEESPYELDPDFPDDEYLEAGDEYEISAEYKED